MSATSDVTRPDHCVFVETRKLTALEYDLHNRPEVTELILRDRTKDRPPRFWRRRRDPETPVEPVDCNVEHLFINSDVYMWSWTHFYRFPKLKSITIHLKYEKDFPVSSLEKLAEICPHVENIFVLIYETSEWFYASHGLSKYIEAFGKEKVTLAFTKGTINPNHYFARSLVKRYDLKTDTWDWDAPKIYGRTLPLDDIINLLRGVIYKGFDAKSSNLIGAMADLAKPEDRNVIYDYIKKNVFGDSKKAAWMRVDKDTPEYLYPLYNNIQIDEGSFFRHTLGESQSYKRVYLKAKGNIFYWSTIPLQDAEELTIEYNAYLPVFEPEAAPNLKHLRMHDIAFHTVQKDWDEMRNAPLKDLNVEKISYIERGMFNNSEGFSSVPYAFNYPKLKEIELICVDGKVGFNQCWETMAKRCPKGTKVNIAFCSAPFRIAPDERDALYANPHFDVEVSFLTSREEADDLRQFFEEKYPKVKILN